MKRSTSGTETKPDTSWPYDVSLAIGTSLDLEANCESVLQALVAKARLEYAAVWIRQQFLAEREPSGQGIRVCAIPSRDAETRELPQTHALFTRPRTEDLIIGTEAEMIVGGLVPAAESGSTVPLVGALGELGSLVLMRRRPFTRHELFQLRRLIGAFTTSLEACLEHRREVARRLRMEKALALLRAQTRRTAWSRPAFVTTLGHEMRTPMNGIIGMSELLLRTHLGSDQREFVTVIRDEARMLLHVINTALELAELEAGDLLPVTTDFDVRDVITAVTDMMAAKGHDRNVSLRAHVDEDLPEALHGDVQLLQRILLESVENAVRHTKNDDVHITAERYTVTDSHVTIRFGVRSRMTGIPDGEEWDTLQPFAATRPDGEIDESAIGLVIARRLVELLGGTTGIDSVEGRGTTFWFTLPFGPGSASTAYSSSTSNSSQSDP